MIVYFCAFRPLRGAGVGLKQFKKDRHVWQSVTVFAQLSALAHRPTFVFFAFFCFYSFLILLLLVLLLVLLLLKNVNRAIKFPPNIGQLTMGLRVYQSWERIFGGLFQPLERRLGWFRCADDRGLVTLLFESMRTQPECIESFKNMPRSNVIDRRQ